MKRFILIFTIALLCACDQEEPQLRLTSSERVQVDTLFTREVKTLRPILDSLCEVMQGERLPKAVDSLLEVRREEERRLRARIPKESVEQ